MRVRRARSFARARRSADGPQGIEDRIVGDLHRETRTLGHDSIQSEERFVEPSQLRIGARQVEVPVPALARPEISAQQLGDWEAADPTE